MLNCRRVCVLAPGSTAQTHACSLVPVLQFFTSERADLTDSKRGQEPSSPYIRERYRGCMLCMYVHTYVRVRRALSVGYVAVRYGAAAVSRSGFAPYLAELYLGRFIPPYRKRPQKAPEIYIFVTEGTLSLQMYGECALHTEGPFSTQADPNSWGLRSACGLPTQGWYQGNMRKSSMHRRRNVTTPGAMPHDDGDFFCMNQASNSGVGRGREGEGHRVRSRWGDFGAFIIPKIDCKGNVCRSMHPQFFRRYLAYSLVLFVLFATLARHRMSHTARIFAGISWVSAGDWLTRASGRHTERNSSQGAAEASGRRECNNNGPFWCRGVLPRAKPPDWKLVPVARRTSVGAAFSSAIKQQVYLMYFACTTCRGHLCSSYVPQVSWHRQASTHANSHCSFELRTVLVRRSGGVIGRVFSLCSQGVRDSSARCLRTCQGSGTAVHQPTKPCPRPVWLPVCKTIRTLSHLLTPAGLSLSFSNPRLNLHTHDIQ